VLRIVGVNRHEDPRQEFVLLQNQGTLRARLRGHILLSETAIESGDLERWAYVIPDDEMIPAGLYVLVSTGAGVSHWARTKDGAHVYHAYMDRSASVWSRSEGPVHLSSLQQSFCGRREALLLR